MTIKYGLLLEKDTSFDLEPFPMIPAGALKTDSIFLVENGLHLLSQVGAHNIFVVVDVGAVYLIEAISKWEGYSDFNFAYSSDVADNPLSTIFKNVFDLLENSRTKTVAIVPGNTITDLDMRKVERFHNDKKKPPMTLVVSPGVPEESYENMPLLYRPTSIAIIEPSMVPHLRGKECGSLSEIISILDEKRAVNYYTHDGLMFEVESPEVFTLLNGTGEPPEKDDSEE